MSMPVRAVEVTYPANYWHDKQLCRVTEKKEDGTTGRVYIEWTEGSSGAFFAGSFQPGAYFGEQANV